MSAKLQHSNPDVEVPGIGKAVFWYDRELFW